MSDHKFDRLLSEIRNERVDDQVVSQAGNRVWSSLTEVSAAELSTHRLRSCEDFQTLVPAYLDKKLPEARRFLFEDHMHQCVECRHAVEQARSGEAQPARQPAWQPASPITLHSRSESRGFTAWRWAMAAAAAVVVVAGTLALGNGVFPGQHAVRG